MVARLGWHCAVDFVGSAIAKILALVCLRLGCRDDFLFRHIIVGHLLHAQLRGNPSVVELCVGDDYCSNFWHLYGALCRSVVARGKAFWRLGNFSRAGSVGGERMVAAAGDWRWLECARLFASLSTGD